MKLELNNFERLTVRFAVFEAFTELSCNFSGEEIKTLKAVYDRLEPYIVSLSEDTKNGNTTTT
jgi:hypothetical protein